MSTSPIISYLALDAQNDPVFAPGTALTNGDAVAQIILTRLNLFMGEWWENLNLGLPVFQQMLGQLASQTGLAAMRLSVQQLVAGVPYVTAVTSVSTSFKGGALQFTVTAQTAFGPVTVTNAPGAYAAVGG